MSWDSSMKEKYPNHYNPWTKDLTNMLIDKFLVGQTIEELSTLFGRTENAIAARLNNLGLYNFYDSKAPRDTFLRNRESIKGKIKSNKNCVESKLTEVFEAVMRLAENTDEFIKLNETNRLLDPEVRKLKKLFNIAVKDMVDNGWYKDKDEAMFFLLDRIEKGE